MCGQEPGQVAKASGLNITPSRTQWIGEKEFPHLWQGNRYAWGWRQSSTLPEESRKASKTKQTYLPSPMTVGRLSKFAFSVQMKALALRTAAEPHPPLRCSLTFPVQACVGPPQPHTSCSSAAAGVLGLASTGTPRRANLAIVYSDRWVAHK